MSDYMENKDMHELDDRSILQKLKQNDESITGLSVDSVEDYHGECFFNSVNWKEDGCCIARNTQLKRLDIHRLELKEGKGHNHGHHHECTRQQIQGFFSCIHRNRSIDHIKLMQIIINDGFGGGLIEELCGPPSLVRLEFSREWGCHRLGHIGCTAISTLVLGYWDFFPFTQKDTT